MATVRAEMETFRGQLETGAIQTAYRALLAYVAALRSHLAGRLPDATVSGVYQGALDMTYFALVPPSLRARNLKIAIVFEYGAFRFVAWLAAGNRAVQRRYWERIRQGRWPRYRIATPGKGVDAILECDLATRIDLDAPDALTSTIEAATLAFIEDVETFLARRA